GADARGRVAALAAGVAVVQRVIDLDRKRRVFAVVEGGDLLQHAVDQRAGRIFVERDLQPAVGIGGRADDGRADQHVAATEAQGAGRAEHVFGGRVDGGPTVARERQDRAVVVSEAAIERIQLDVGNRGVAVENKRGAVLGEVRIRSETGELRHVVDR